MTDNDPRALIRKDLTKFLPNQRAVRAFEKLFELVPSALNEALEQSGDSSISSKVAAISQLLEEAEKQLHGGLNSSRFAALLQRIEYLENDSRIDPRTTDLLNRIEEIENDNRFASHIAALRQELDGMNTDFSLEVAKGNIAGHTSINKFGAAPSGLQTTATDVWVYANAATTQSIWLAPTAANTHTISSDSASDVSGGTGTTSVTVYYLPDWDTAETSVTVTGDINAGVSMEVDCVMINRMVALPQSTTTAPGPNKGTIIATAAAPSATTITAVILPGDGQTEQAIFGFPSTQTAYMTRWAVGIDKNIGGVATADFQIRFNPNPDVQTVAFQRKQDVSVQSTGTNSIEKVYSGRPKFDGPGIIKVQGIASANDLDAHADFDLILVEDGY